MEENSQKKTADQIVAERTVGSNAFDATKANEFAGVVDPIDKFFERDDIAARLHEQEQKSYEEFFRNPEVARVIDNNEAMIDAQRDEANKAMAERIVAENTVGDTRMDPALAERLAGIVRTPEEVYTPEVAQQMHDDRQREYDETFAMPENVRRVEEAEERIDEVIDAANKAMAERIVAENTVGSNEFNATLANELAGVREPEPALDQVGYEQFFSDPEISRVIDENEAMIDEQRDSANKEMAERIVADHTVGSNEFNAALANDLAGVREPIESFFARDDIAARIDENEALIDGANEVVQTNEETETIEYIPGTNIPRPRDREPYESDEDYVQFLNEYYAPYYNDEFRNPDAIAEEPVVEEVTPVQEEPVAEVPTEDPVVEAVEVPEVAPATVEEATKNEEPVTNEVVPTREDIIVERLAALQANHDENMRHLLTRREILENTARNIADDNPAKEWYQREATRISNDIANAERNYKNKVELYKNRLEEEQKVTEAPKEEVVQTLSRSRDEVMQDLARAESNYKENLQYLLLKQRMAQDSANEYAATHDGKKHVWYDQQAERINKEIERLQTTHAKRIGKYREELEVIDKVDTPVQSVEQPSLTDVEPVKREVGPAALTEGVLGRNQDVVEETQQPTTLTDRLTEGMPSKTRDVVEEVQQPTTLTDKLIEGMPSKARDAVEEVQQPTTLTDKLIEGMPKKEQQLSNEHALSSLVDAWRETNADYLRKKDELDQQYANAQTDEERLAIQRAIRDLMNENVNKLNELRDRVNGQQRNNANDPRIGEPTKENESMVQGVVPVVPSVVTNDKKEEQEDREDLTVVIPPPVQDPATIEPEVSAFGDQPLAVEHEKETNRKEPASVVPPKKDNQTTPEAKKPSTITSKRRPTKRERLKKSIKRNWKKLVGAILALAAVLGIGAAIKSEAPDYVSPPVPSIVTDTELDDEIIDEEIEEEIEEEIQLGSQITVTPGSSIYDSWDRAAGDFDGENPYFGYDSERYVTGVQVQRADGTSVMVTSQEELDAELDHGSTVQAYRTRNEYSGPSGHEGWWNPGDVQVVEQSYGGKTR